MLIFLMVALPEMSLVQNEQEKLTGFKDLTAILKILNSGILVKTFRQLSMIPNNCTMDKNIRIFSLG